MMTTISPYIALGFPTGQIQEWKLTIKLTVTCDNTLFPWTNHKLALLWKVNISKASFRRLYDTNSRHLACKYAYKSFPNAQLTRVKINGNFAKKTVYVSKMHPAIKRKNSVHDALWKDLCDYFIVVLISPDVSHFSRIKLIPADKITDKTLNIFLQTVHVTKFKRKMPLCSPV